MFNKKAILLVIIFSLFAASCTNSFNPYDVKDVKDETSSDDDENMEPLPNGQGKMKFTITSIVFRNINSRTANRNAITGSVRTIYSYALFGYDMKVDFYNSLSDKHSLSSFAKLTPKSIRSALLLNVNTVGHYHQRDIIVSKSYSLFYDNSYNYNNPTILLTINLTKYDEHVGDFLHRVHYPYAYSENDKIKIELGYRYNNFFIRNMQDEYKNENEYIKRVISYNLTKNQYGEGELYMLIYGNDKVKSFADCGRGPTGFNRRIEIRIKFKMEIIH
uniref:hypothetical protein n=1 Tax=Brachyspira catarrhinii TaxID=2528966 RepID=UPI003F4C20D3